MNNKLCNTRFPGKRLVLTAMLAAASPPPALAQFHVEQTIGVGDTLIRDSNLINLGDIKATKEVGATLNNQGGGIS